MTELRWNDLSVQVHDAYQNLVADFESFLPSDSAKRLAAIEANRVSRDLRSLDSSYRAPLANRRTWRSALRLLGESFELCAERSLKHTPDAVAYAKLADHIVQSFADIKDEFLRCVKFWASPARNG